MKTGWDYGPVMIFWHGALFRSFLNIKFKISYFVTQTGNHLLVEIQLALKGTFLFRPHCDQETNVD